MDQGHLLTTLEGYNAGPHMRKLLEVFWYRQGFFTRQKGYHGPHFKENKGINQGRIILPTLFNLIVDNVVRKFLALMVEDQLIAQEGLVLVVGRFLELFHNKNGMVGSQDPEWLQGSLNLLTGLF